MNPDPRILVVLRADGSGTVDGRTVTIPPGADRHVVLMTEACRIAATIGRPVRVTACDADTEWELLAAPDGEVTPLGGGRPRSSGDAAPPRVSPLAPTTEPGVKTTGRAVVPAVRTGGPVATSRPGLVATGGDSPPPRRAPGRPGAVVWSTRAPRRVRPPSLPLLGGLVVGALLLALVAVMTLPGTDPAMAEKVVTTVTRSPAAGSPSAAPSARPSATSSGASPVAVTTSRASTVPTPGARLAAAVPPGFDAVPAWSAQVAAWTRTVAADDGTVLTRDPAGHLLLLDPVSGGERWRSEATTSAQQDGPWLTTIGSRAAAVVTNDLLSYWTLPTSSTPSGGPGGSGVGVRIPAGAKVSWVGPSPLVTVPSGGAGVIRGASYVAVPLPRGARALAASGTTVLAVAGATFVQQPAGRSAVRPRALPRPKGAKARPVRVEAVGTAFLLTVWPRASGKGYVVGLVDTKTGDLVVQTALGARIDLTHAPVVRESAGTQTLLGSVLVDTYTSNIDLLDPRYTVRVVSRGHAWSVFNGHATDIHLGRGTDFTTVPFAAGRAALPVGVVGAASGRAPVAVVVTPYKGGWVLSALKEAKAR